MHGGLAHEYHNMCERCISKQSENDGILIRRRRDVLMHYSDEAAGEST